MSAVRRCAAQRGDGPPRRRCATPAGRRRRGGGGGTPFPAPRPPRHGNVAARAPVHARGHGAGRLTRYICVAERATALKARVLHVRAWNSVFSNRNTGYQAAQSRQTHRRESGAHTMVLFCNLQRFLRTRFPQTRWQGHQPPHTAPARPMLSTTSRHGGRSAVEKRPDRDELVTIKATEPDVASGGTRRTCF